VAIGGVWGVVQVVEKVANFRLNRQKLQEGVKKLQRANAQAAKATTVDDTESSVFIFENPRFLSSRLIERKAMEDYERIRDRLLSNTITISGLEVDVVTPSEAYESTESTSSRDIVRDRAEPSGPR
jgi:hypothetical protein